MSARQFLGEKQGPAPFKPSLAPRAAVQRVKFSVSGTTTSAGKDQVPFFYAIADTAKDSGHDLVTPTPAVTRFNALQVGQYVERRPAQIVNINVTGADSSETVSSMVVEPVRYEIAGAVLTDRIDADDFQDARDFQTTRVTIPMDYTVDGWSFIRLINDQNNSPNASYTVSFTLNFSVDQRAEVARINPRVTKSSAAS